jgi:hypothetical protein
LTLLLLAAGGFALLRGFRLLDLNRNAIALRKRIAALPAPAPLPAETGENGAELREPEGEAALPAGEVPAPPEDAASRFRLLRELLERRGFRPQRIRVSGAEAEEKIEFTLNGTIRPFLDFLGDAVAQAMTEPESLNIRMRAGPEFSQEAEIQIRFGGGSGGSGVFPERNSTAPPDNAALARIFRQGGGGAGGAPHESRPALPPPEATGAEKAVAAGELAPEPGEEDGAARGETLVFLGSIEDGEGQKFAYYREKDSGLIVKTGIGEEEEE